MDAGKVQTVRLNAKLRCTAEERNRLNRDIILEEFTLGTDVTGGRVLIADSTLSLLHGRKYGLVGRNGVGKTTLLRALAGHQIEGLFDHMRCVYVDDGTESATALGDGATAVEYLVGQHERRRSALAELKRVMETDEAVDIEALEDVCRRVALVRADTAEGDARRILVGLGVEPDAVLSTLSGGWRHRVALAAALFVDSDLLLLDEPTRSLDLAATAWLEKFLAKLPVTVVVVSHDLEFLDAFTTHTIQIEDRALRTVAGNHSQFLQVLAADEAHKQRAYTAQESRRKRWEATIEKMQKRAETCGDAARQVRSRKISLEKRLGAALDGTYWKYGLMGPRPLVEAPTSEDPVDFELLTDTTDVPESAGDGETLLVRLANAGYRFAGEGMPMVFAGANLDITLSTRLALVGPNGTGKSTLLSILAGDRDPTSGDILRWDGLRVAYLQQDATKLLRSDSDTLRWLMAQHPTLMMDEAVDVLRGFGLASPDTLATPVTSLSDGQRTRLLLADIQCDQPHLLLLDEPTGHLDAQSAAALAAALDYFGGAVVVASHDRVFLRSISPALVAFGGGSVAPFRGDIDEFVRRQAALTDALASAAVAKAAPAKPKAARPASGTKPASGPPAPVHGQAAAVSCRKCGGPHFTFACDVKKDTPKQEVKPRAAPDDAKPIKLVEKATDGKGSWKVVVSKQTLRDMQRR